MVTICAQGGKANFTSQGENARWQSVRAARLVTVRVKQKQFDLDIRQHAAAAAAAQRSTRRHNAHEGSGIRESAGKFRQPLVAVRFLVLCEVVASVCSWPKPPRCPTGNMHVWDYRNRRHRGLARKPPRPRAYASSVLTRDGQQHEQE